MPIKYCISPRPLLGTTWPELTRHYLEAAAAAGTTSLNEEARAALAALRTCDYASLPARDRLALLEALIQAAVDAETLHKCALGFPLRDKLPSLCTFTVTARGEFTAAPMWQVHLALAMRFAMQAMTSILHESLTEKANCV